MELRAQIDEPQGELKAQMERLGEMQDAVSEALDNTDASGKEAMEEELNALRAELAEVGREQRRRKSPPGRPRRRRSQTR